MAMGNIPGGPPGLPPVGGEGPPLLATDDDKQLAMFCHASALAGVLAIGLGMWVGPLILWMSKKETSPVAAYHAGEALNFQLNILVVILLTASLAFINSFFLILPAAAVLYAGAMAVIVGMKASEGIAFPYPKLIRVIK